MTLWAPVLLIAASLAVWVLLGLLEEGRRGTRLHLWLLVLRGGVLALVFCFLGALVLAEVLWGLARGVPIPFVEDPRRQLFVAIAIGLGMIGFPLGALLALAGQWRGV